MAVPLNPISFAFAPSAGPAVSGANPYSYSPFSSGSFTVGGINNMQILLIAGLIVGGIYLWKR